MKRFVLALVAAFATLRAPQLATAQAAPPVKTIGIAQAAKTTLDSLAKKTRTDRVEVAACLTSYAVQADTLVVLGVAKANYAKADSINLWAFADTLGNVIPICPIGVPTIHSHLHPPGILRPSPTDLDTQKSVGMWALILVVEADKWGFIVY